MSWGNLHRARNHGFFTTFLPWRSWEFLYFFKKCPGKKKKKTIQKMVSSVLPWITPRLLNVDGGYDHSPTWRSHFGIRNPCNSHHSRETSRREVLIHPDYGDKQINTTILMVISPIFKWFQWLCGVWWLTCQWIDYDLSIEFDPADTSILPTGLWSRGPSANFAMSASLSSPGHKWGIPPLDGL